MVEKSAPVTAIGEVQIYVSDLGRAVDFYEKSLGFKVFSRQPGEAILGVGDRRLLTIIERIGAKPAQGTTGLYHFAVLLPDRKSLARLLYWLSENKVAVQGVADHGVSEALYLSDPDGNGIELYRDRRRSEWPVDDLGRLQMGTEELDIEGLVFELKNGLEPWTGLPDQTVIGHVHLKVRDLAEAEQFYTKVLGFDLMQRYESGAIFVSTGGYHHHIGLNTWGVAGAPPPPPNSTGLRWFEIVLPNAQAYESMLESLRAAGIDTEQQAGGVLVRDPSQNAILICVGVV